MHPQLIGNRLCGRGGVFACNCHRRVRTATMRRTPARLCFAHRSGVALHLAHKLAHNLVYHSLGDVGRHSALNDDAHAAKGERRAIHVVAPHESRRARRVGELDKCTTMAIANDQISRWQSSKQFLQLRAQAGLTVGWARAHGLFRQLTQPDAARRRTGRGEQRRGRWRRRRRHR